MLFSGVVSTARAILDFRHNLRKCRKTWDVDGDGQSACQNGCRTHGLVSSRVSVSLSVSSTLERLSLDAARNFMGIVIKQLSAPQSTE